MEKPFAKLSVVCDEIRRLPFSQAAEEFRKHMMQKDAKILFGRNVEFVRNLVGLTAMQLARTIGTNHVRIGRIEAGEAFVSFDTALLISQKLQMPLTVLLKTDICKKGAEMIRNLKH